MQKLFCIFERLFWIFEIMENCNLAIVLYIFYLSLSVFGNFNATTLVFTTHKTIRRKLIPRNCTETWKVTREKPPFICKSYFVFLKYKCTFSKLGGNWYLAILLHKFKLSRRALEILMPQFECLRHTRKLIPRNCTEHLI